MPIWIKCIFMLWIVNFVLFIFVRIWAMDVKNLPRIITSDYPKWVVAEGVITILSILSIIPTFVWFIFLR